MTKLLLYGLATIVAGCASLSEDAMRRIVFIVTLLLAPPVCADGTLREAVERGWARQPAVSAERDQFDTALAGSGSFPAYARHESRGGSHAGRAGADPSAFHAARNSQTFNQGGCQITMRSGNTRDDHTT